MVRPGLIRGFVIIYTKCEIFEILFLWRVATRTKTFHYVEIHLPRSGDPLKSYAHAISMEGREKKRNGGNG